MERSIKLILRSWSIKKGFDEVNIFDNYYVILNFILYYFLKIENYLIFFLFSIKTNSIKYILIFYLVNFLQIKNYAFSVNIKI